MIIKYPNINNHESFVDFIQPDVNDRIKRGIARIINRIGDTNK